MKKKSRFVFGYITVAILLLLIIGSILFIRTMRNTLWQTLAYNDLELTKQGADSFASKLDSEAVSVDNLAVFLSEVASTDIENIKVSTRMFAEEQNIELSVIDMEHSRIYTTAKNEVTELTPLQEDEFSAYGKSGWLEPFYSSYDGIQYIGYYEKFYFSDGVQGIIQKDITMKSLGERYSLSFYDGQGYSYVIDKDGNIIVRAQDKYSNRTLGNVFDVLHAGSNSDDSVELFKRSIVDQKNGVMRFDFDGEPFVFAFSATGGADDWSFLSLIPETALSARLDSIMRTSTLTVVLVVVIFVIVLILIVNKKLALKETELQDALVVAQSANRAKTVFLNNISHDIRTPMNAIIGYTALAAKHIDNQQSLKDYLEKISKSSAHLLSLINDVLDMSRIESGKVNINEKEESLSEILHSVRDIVQEDIYARNLEFFVDTVDVTDEDIYCDRLRLNQILLNILSNAIKYTPSGGYVSLRILELKTSKTGYGTYEFRIKDNGIGMSEEFVDMVFDPFARERNSTASGVQGTGLGMTITKNIVDMMGGTIVCHSKENEGTEFVVTLDFRLQTEHKEIEKIAEIEGLRGLVVDDDMNACQSISQMLRQIGMRSEWCTQGKEAIVRTQEAIRLGDGFAVYIIDWQMPEMNGIEVARRIRRVVGEDAPIIILTAYDWSDIEEEAREAGVTGFVSKPVFPSDLRNVLMKACGRIEEVPDKKGDSKEVSLEGKKILVVEDNELNREIVAELLREAGLIVDEAEDGNIAVNMLQEKGEGYYNLVLMDIQMPVMDGYTAAKKIRSFDDKELADIPIIALSANAFEEDKKQSLDVGMNAHISKPIDSKILMDTLASMMR